MKFMVNSNNTNNDEVVATQKIYTSQDYDKFQLMKGNRPVDERHVKSLARKMERDGNLMDKFPIIVNEHFFIVDGQHRTLAAQLNKMPVYYVVIDNSTLDTVVALNTDNKNWNWLNFAQSWAARGNVNYIEFIRLYEEYKYNYRILMRYCGTGGTSNRDSTDWQRFRAGDLEIKDVELTRKLLKQYSEISEEAALNVREFAVATYSFMRTPEYKHHIMLQKVRQFGEGLRRCYTTTDFLIELENIYKA